MIKVIVPTLAAMLTTVSALAATKPAAQLQCDASQGVAGSVEMPNGKVNYTAFTHLYYVTNVEDSTYQSVNVFVPDGATQQSPIFLKTNVGGYMPSAPSFPSAGDAEKIVTDGTSAGGAMSALTGATGNNPAYEKYLKAMGAASGENDEFGNSSNNPANFTSYSAAKNNTTVTVKVKEEEYLLNPMPQIGQSGVTVAPHWYIRHGSIDRDTAFPVALNLATKLENAGKDVNFLLAWNRPHSGDYALNELFDWLDKLVK